VTGYLGEREQFGWWQSAFFGLGSQAFLTPVFGRTLLLAQASGVTRSAAAIHDERIGVGSVYHLFRLPEDLEQGIHRALHDPHLKARLSSLLRSREEAMAFLHGEAGEAASAEEGPVWVSAARDLAQPSHWRTVAAFYLRAFERGGEVYPYFADRAA
jgi:hypothetical protein